MSIFLHLGFKGDSKLSKVRDFKKSECGGYLLDMLKRKKVIIRIVDIHPLEKRSVVKADGLEGK